MEHCYILQHSYEDENGCHETKFIGVYTSRELADATVKRLIEQPGFRDRPGDFFIDKYEFNQDHWTEGYNTVTTIQVKDKYDKWFATEAICLINGTFKIYNPHDEERFGDFKHNDIVECEERDGYLYAKKKAKGQ